MRSKNLAVFDIDKTLSRDLLIVSVIQAEEAARLLIPGTFSAVAGLLAAYKKGEMDYEDVTQQVIATHAAGLRGRTVAELHDNARAFLAEHTDLFRRFGKEVMNLLRSTHELVVVTAEPTYMAAAVVGLLHMDRALASEYEIKDGKFTGNIERSLAYRRDKRRLIGDLRPDFAFGDSSGDIEMLSHARHPICIDPDVELAAAARENGWEMFDGEDDTKKIIQSINRDLVR